MSINNGDCTSNIAADVIAPTFTFNPVNAATAVAVNSNVTITASEAIRLVDNSAVTDANVGTLITLKDTDVNGAVIPSTATISGNVITINPTADFSSLQQVYVAINGAAVEDTSDNAGASANATFTTADTSAPTLTSSTPADDATGVAVGSNIVLTFSENIATGTGNIVVSDGSIDTRTIDIGDAQISVSGATLTINPTADLNSSTTYYVQIDATAVDDLAGNSYAGIADTTTLNFSTAVTVANDLVDQIRNPLKNILQSDFEQTVATQSRQFSQVSKGALGRLQSDSEKRCGVVEALDADGRAQAGAGGFNTSGVFGEEYYDCETGVRRILDGSFAINRSDAVDAQGIVSFTIQNEKQKADEALNGTFFGGYLSSSSLDGIATGNLRGVGVHAGLYGARKLPSGLFFDYYAAVGVGRHEYDVSFYAPSAPITAEGDYRYGAVYAGAALSGEAEYESVTFRPRVGFDLTYADASDASVSASQLGFTNLGRIQLDAINGSRIFAETIWIFGDKNEDLITGELSLERALEVAPRLYCEQVVGRDELDCGYGGYISFNEHNLSKGSDITVTVDYENNKERSERLGLELSYSRDIFDGSGAVATRFGSDHLGNVTISQSLDFKF